MQDGGLGGVRPAPQAQAEAREGLRAPEEDGCREGLVQEF